MRKLERDNALLAGKLIFSTYFHLKVVQSNFFQQKASTCPLVTVGVKLENKHLEIR